MVDLLGKLPRELTVLAQGIVAGIPEAEAFLVGGAVRDTILGRETKDYDMVVRGVPAAKLEAWLAGRGAVNLVGKTFGVFKWQPEGWAHEALDVALPRTEHVARGTGQYRDFAVQSNAELPIEDDLLRRDFTVNALALNLINGKLIDPSGGEQDIVAKLLRTVGSAAQRFSEDLSRTLRGIRFACQLGFELEATTWLAIQAHSQRTASGKATNGELLVPREIVARELLKALAANPSHALQLLDESGFLPELLPEVAAMKGCPQPPEFHSEGDVFQHTLLALTELTGDRWGEFFGTAAPSLNAIVGVLLHDIGKPLTLKTPERDGSDRIRTNEHDTVGAKLVSQICERLKLTSYVDPARGQVEPRIVEWLVQYHMLLVYGQPEALKPTTIYRYFLEDYDQGQAFQHLIFADSASTRPADGRDLTESLRRLRARLPEFEAKLSHGKLVLLLSGTDIMTNFKLKQSPKVGELMRALEEAQLESKVTNREEALAYLQALL